MRPTPILDADLERESALSRGLAQVIRVTDQLLLCPDEDTLLRRAVDLAREELGVERFSIYLDLPDRTHLVGTYGTDMDGKTTSESHYVIESSDEKEEKSSTRWVYRDKKFLSKDAKVRKFVEDRDWMVLTPIHSASGRIGVTFMDAAITKAPVNETLLDIVTIYCSMLGTMIESKRAAEAVRRSQRETSEGLGLVLDMADELIACHDLDALLRRAIEMVHERLGIRRFSIYLKGDDPEFLQGTYGVDRQGNIRDEKHWKVGIGALKMPIPASKNALSRLSIYQEARPETEIMSEMEGQSIRDWVVTTPIQSSQGIIGICFNDNALDKQPMDEAQQEKLAVFCSMLGNMIESQRAAQAMRESQRSIATLMSNLPGMAYRSRNNAARTLEFVSQGVMELTGFAPEALVANRDIAFADLIHPDDREMVTLRVRAAVSARTSFQLTYRISTRDGTQKWVFEQGSGLFSPEGEVAAIEGFVADITARKHAEEELSQAKDELEIRVKARTAELARANERLRIENLERQLAMGQLHEVAEALRIAKNEAERANAAKSEFLSRMSHELRTPLNAVLGFGQILRREELNNRSAESVEHILKGGHHLLELINEVLDIARVESGSLDIALEPVALENIIAECCALLHPLAQERQIHIEANLCQFSGKYVRSDPQRLKQVMLNLLGNAIKYNIEGGAVTLCYHSDSQGRARIAVCDTGVGISLEGIDKLFSPFERLDAANSGVEGTGLGLALSRRLVEAMGGTLRIERSAQSGPDQGSTFLVELADCDAAQIETDAADPTINLTSPGEFRPKSKRVLVIEDNLSNLRLLQVLLENRPQIKLYAAMQGSIGLDLARQHRPDLILLDLNLPDISCKEVLERLRESTLTCDIPVVIISADATSPQVEWLLSAGAKRYLTKPIDVSLFFAVLDELLD